MTTEVHRLDHIADLDRPFFGGQKTGSRITAAVGVSFARCLFHI